VHYRAYVVFVLLIQIGACRADAPEATEETARASSVKEERVRSARPSAALLKTLEEREASIARAMDQQDWIKAKQQIHQTMALLERNGREYDLQKARVTLALGTVMRETGNEVEARRHYADAMAIFHVHKDPDGRFRTTLAIGELDARKGDYSAAARQHELAGAFLPDLKDKTLPAVFKLAGGRLASRQVDHEAAYQNYLEARKIYDTLKDSQAVAETLLLVASEEDALNKPRSSQRSLDKALRLFRENKNIEGQARALHHMAVLAERDKKYKRARQLLSQVCEHYDELGQRSAAATVRRHLSALPESD
jgi:tetratricopeptide (TPR) repeat protein